MRRKRFVSLSVFVLVVATLGIYRVWGQNDIQISNIQADSVTKTSARIGFRTTKAGIYRLLYGVDQRYGYISSSASVTNAAVMILTGLPADRDIHYRVCYLPDNSDQMLCTADQVVHTAKADTPGVELAVLPKTFDAPMPTVNGLTFTVNDKCTDLQQQLQLAAQADGDLNHQVLLPPQAVCYGNFEFQPKRGPNPRGEGVIIVRTAAPDSALPPEGMRISPAWEKSMARIANNAIFSNSDTSLPGQCSPEEFFWLRSSPNENKFHACVDKNTWKPVESLPFYRTGTSIPAGCDEGQLFFLQASEAGPQYSLYRCVIGGNAWIPLNPRGDGGAALSNPYEQTVRGYRFVGIIFEPAEATGLSYGTLLNIGNYSNGHENVVADRCIFRVPATASVIRALDLNGSRVGVINSWFDMRVAAGAHPYNPSAGSQIINITGGTGPFKIVNNYIRGAGILLFVNDNDSRVPRDDIEVRRNNFSYNDDHRCGSPTSDGICRDVRGPIELKRGRRVLFEGNIIENFWSTLSGGQAFIITPRASGSNGPDRNEYQISDLTIRYNIVRNGSGFVQIVGQDDVGYRNTKITQRVTITDNLVTGINGFTQAAKDYGPTRGQILAIANGAEDVTFRHNTVVNNRGTGPAFLHGSYAAVGGLDYRDNILWVNPTQAGGGIGIRWSEPAFLPNGLAINRASEQAVLNAMALRIPNASYQFSNNVIIAGPGVKVSDLRKNYPNAASNFFSEQAAVDSDPVGFEDMQSGNLRVNVASPFKGISSDRNDPGANIDEISKRSGEIRAQWIGDVFPDAATLIFYPPDSFRCLVEVSESNSFTNPIRVRDESAEEEDRHMIRVAGLKPDTAYFYRLLCSSATAQGDFRTSGVQ